MSELKEHADHKRVALVPILSKGESVAVFNESNDLKKAFEVRLNTGESYPLSREMVYCFFDIPAVEAARIMCVSLSLLKKIRTWVRVERWPCFLIHTGEFKGLTRIQVVQGRDEVISELERECEKIQKSNQDGQASGSSTSKKKRKFDEGVINRQKELGLALKILKEARDYAALYLRLVVPDAGRRQSATMTMKDGGDTGEGGCDSMGKSSIPVQNSTQKTSHGDSASVELPRGVQEIVEQMQPRQVVKRKAGVLVTTLVNPEESFWPVSITQAFDFDQLFTGNDNYEIEDELRLGPVTVSTNVSTTVVMERGPAPSHSTISHSACSGSDVEDFGLLGE